MLERAFLSTHPKTEEIVGNPSGRFALGLPFLCLGAVQREHSGVRSCTCPHRLFTASFVSVQFKQILEVYKQATPKSLQNLKRLDEGKFRRRDAIREISPATCRLSPIAFHMSRVAWSLTVRMRGRKRAMVG